MLYIHNRQTRSNEVAQSLTLNLARAFFTDERSSSDLAQARALLADLHRDRAWLACDCAAGPDDTWPMIGPRDGRGGMHPFRFGSVAHREDCPFAATIRQRGAVSGQDDDTNAPLEGDWPIASMFPAGQPDEARRAAMSRLLRTALVQLGFDRLHISAFDPNARAMRLRETPFSRLRHLGAQPIDGGRTFHEVGLTFLPALPRWLRELASRLPNSTCVGGLYLGVTDMVVKPEKPGAPGFLTSRDTQGQRRTIPLQGSVFLPDGDSGMLGPYWTLALIIGDGKGRWDLGDALAHPALDRRTLLPVPSAAHRAVATLLLEQMQFWRSWKKLAVEVELAAPLFPSPYPIVPAFTLVLPNEARIDIDVETSASRADGIVTFPLNDPDPDGTRRRLTAAVARAMKPQAR